MREFKPVVKVKGGHVDRTGIDGLVKLKLDDALVEVVDGEGHKHWRGGVWCKVGYSLGGSVVDAVYVVACYVCHEE